MLGANLYLYPPIFIFDYNREFYPDYESYKNINLKAKGKFSNLMLRCQKNIPKTLIFAIFFYNTLKFHYLITPPGFCSLKITES